MSATKTVTERTSEGLREVLFAELDALRNGTIEPPRAHATAKLAQQILTSVALEISSARLFDAGANGVDRQRKLPNLKLVG